ncbi:MAG TPA: hypothetical protein VF223_19000 [Trebonia sp.]
MFLAPDPAGSGAPLSAEAVRRTARHVLPAAPESYEARPVALEPGLWAVSVAAWVLRLRLEMPAEVPVDAVRLDGDQQPVTVGTTVTRRGGVAGATRKDAVARVRGYFERNATARLAMAYYYQEFILGFSPPQTVPMLDVVIALNLSGEGAVSDYKKLLQGFIWSERGHARDLTGFLLTNGLLTLADLNEARLVAEKNERDGVCDMTRQRLRYRPKGKLTGFRLIAWLRRAAVNVRVHVGVVERARQDRHRRRADVAAVHGAFVIAALASGDGADNEPDDKKQRSNVHLGLP